jgi:hypothetical protein
MPADVRANDLAHWQVRLRVGDPEALARRLRESGAWLVSPGVVTLEAPALGFRRGALARDPDGHALQITAE